MPLEEHGLRWIHPEACMAHPLEGGGAAVMYRDLRETVASLDALAPGDGEVRCNARVTGVHASGRRVSGVSLASGERVDAPLVVADVMPHALAAMAGDALPGWYRSLLRRYVYGPSTVKVDWALSEPIPWEA